MNAKYPPIGTVSHGTMRNEDLIPEFAYILEKYAPERYESLRAEYAPIFEEMDVEDFEDFEDQESASHLTDALFEELDAIGAPYTYFGSSEGDGSDYGFWPSIDSLEEDARYVNGVIKVSDGDDWEYSDGRIIIGGERHGLGGGETIDYVMSVSDHGNVTLYDSQTREEIWSVV